MPKGILEAWISPKRNECYHSSVINCNTLDMCMDDPIADLADEHYPGNIFELFEENEQDGLWKIVISVEWRGVEYWTDCGTEYDIDYDVEVLFKAKCKDYKELRANWSILRHV